MTSKKQSPQPVLRTILEKIGRARDAVLELAIRELKVNVQQNSIDIRDLTGRVEALARIDERVTAIERRLS